MVAWAGLSVAMVASGLVASAAGAVAGPASERDFLHARAADVLGDPQRAAAGYARALAAAPADRAIALRAFRQGVLAGDQAVALGGARALDAVGAAPVDASVLLLIDAVAARNWPAAGRRVDLIAADRALGFMAPVLRAWVAFGSGQGDPLALLSAGVGDKVAAPYLAEHRALLLLATGRADDGLAAFRALDVGRGVHGTRLRLAAAAQLVALHRTDAAAGLLDGDDPVLAAARARLAAHRPVGDPIDSAGAGIGEALVRLAIDFSGDRTNPVALAMARLSTFAAPASGEGWLVTASLLATADRGPAALGALDRIRPGDPLAGYAGTTRLQVLIRQDNKLAAVDAARALAAAPGAGADEWARLGDALTATDRFREAAEAYTRAIAFAEAERRAPSQRWQLYLLKGGALDRAGDWAAARPLLEQAVALAPDEPQALNYLGYAELERRQNLARAARLIEHASQLAPDNAAITDSLGWARFLNGDLPGAIDLLEQAAGGDPANPDINEHLGDAYWKAGRRYEARYAWRAALVTADAGDATRLRAKIANGGDGPAR